jgi:hypothetical protein
MAIALVPCVARRRWRFKCFYQAHSLHKSALLRVSLEFPRQQKEISARHRIQRPEAKCHSADYINSIWFALAVEQSG